MSMRERLDYERPIHLIIQPSPMRLMCGLGPRSPQGVTIWPETTLDRAAVTCRNCLRSMAMAGPKLLYVDGVKVGQR